MSEESQSKTPKKKEKPIGKKKPGFLWRLIGGLLKILRKLLKWLLWVVLFLIVFILCGGLGPLVTYVGAPIARMMNIPLSIERCVILPVTGYVRIEKLTIGNPKKFEEVDQAFYGKTPLLKLDTFEFDFAMRTLFSEIWEIENIELTGLRMLYAIEEDTSNIDALIAQIGSGDSADPAATEVATTEVPAESEATPSESAAETAPEASTEAESQTHKIKVNRLHLEDNSVTVRRYISIPPVPLPGLTLHNLDNYTLKEQYETIVKPVKETINMAMTGIGVVGDALGSNVEDVKNVATGAIDVISASVDAVLPEASDHIGEALKSGVDSVKDTIKFW